MPPTLRSRTEIQVSVPARSIREAAPTRSKPRRDDERGAFDNLLLSWIGVAVALSIGSFCALIYTRDPAPGDSVVTAWVAGVAMTLALGPCILCAVLAHRELRRWWGPIGAIAIPALVGFFLILRLR